MEKKLALMGKRGRPHISDPRTHLYRLRLNDEERDMLDYLLRSTNVSVPDLLRKTIKCSFDENFRHEPTELEERNGHES